MKNSSSSILNWNISTRGVYHYAASATPDQLRRIPNQKALIRDDTGEVLAIMSSRYRVIQNAEILDFHSAMFPEGAATTYSAFDSGRRISITSELASRLTIGDDVYTKSVSTVTSHDGSSSLLLAFGVHRQVCSNGITTPVPGASQSLRIRHTASFRARLNSAHSFLNTADDYFSALKATVEPLIARPMPSAEFEAFLRTLIPTPNEREIPTRTANIRSTVTRLFHSGRGNFGKTRYDALNAVTDYVDHERGNPDTRLESSLLGSGATLKNTALTLLQRN